jgi:hypothetical protein
MSSCPFLAQIWILVRSTWNRRSTVFGSACTQICVCTQSRMRYGLGTKLHPPRWAREPLDICSYTWPALTPFGTGCCRFAILPVRTEIHAVLATLLKQKFALSRSSISLSPDIVVAVRLRMCHLGVDSSTCPHNLHSI